VVRIDTGRLSAAADTPILQDKRRYTAALNLRSQGHTDTFPAPIDSWGYWDLGTRRHTYLDHSRHRDYRREGIYTLRPLAVHTYPPDWDRYRRIRLDHSGHSDRAVGIRIDQPMAYTLFRQGKYHYIGERSRHTAQHIRSGRLVFDNSGPQDKFRYIGVLFHHK